MPTPSLMPLPPAPGAVLPLSGATTVTIGSVDSSTLHLEVPGVAPHHAAIESRDGAWWIRPIGGTVELNGVPLTGAARLSDRDQLRIAANLYYEFATGERRTRRMESAADMIARPRKRSSGRLPGARRNVSLAAIATVVIAVLLVVGAAGVAWYGIFRATKSIVVLDDRQAAELDTLLVIAYDHVERGGTLLELGLGDGASDEFAKAVTTLELSDLRNHPLVKPRIQALAASVAAIYRERSLAVPSNYANATSPLTAEQLKTASLSADQFAGNFALMAAGFAAKFGHQIVISGRDHAEHVILYGKGGAMDLSIKDMNPAEVRFIIEQSHGRHIRVKDFSQDSVLRRQVANAIRAGLLFEAGTGLHLHIDRFANRRDRWTTLRTTPSRERPAEFFERRAPGGGLATASAAGGTDAGERQKSGCEERHGRGLRRHCHRGSPEELKIRSAVVRSTDGIGAHLPLDVPSGERGKHRSGANGYTTIGVAGRSGQAAEVGLVAEAQIEAGHVAAAVRAGVADRRKSDRRAEIEGNEGIRPARFGAVDRRGPEGVDGVRELIEGVRVVVRKARRTAENGDAGVIDELGAERRGN